MGVCQSLGRVGRTGGVFTTSCLDLGAEGIRNSRLEAGISTGGWCHTSIGRNARIILRGNQN